MNKFVMPVPSLGVIKWWESRRKQARLPGVHDPAHRRRQFQGAMRAEVYHTLKSVIKKKYGQMRAMSVTKEALLRACRTTLRQWMCPWTQSRSPGLQERSRLEPMSLRQGSGKDHPIGRNVLNTVANLNDITAPKLIGVDVIDLVGVDKLMVDELIEVIRM